MGIFQSCMKVVNQFTESGDDNKEGYSVPSSVPSSGPITVPKWEAASVIGPKGATIKKIQAESGARVNVQNQGDQAIITFEGSDAEVAKARQLVAKALSGAENPQYVSKGAQKLRDEANDWYKKKAEFGKAAHTAYENKEGAKAHEFKEKKEEAERMMEKKNQQAAEMIFKQRNQGKGDLYMDLHGLFVQEAVDFTEKRLQKVRNSKKGSVLEIVTGAGHHSADHKAHIKPKIIAILRNANLQFEEKNAGSLNVHL